MSADDVTVHIEDTAQRLYWSRIAELPGWPWARSGRRTRRMWRIPGIFRGMPIRYWGDPTPPRRAPRRELVES